MILEIFCLLIIFQVKHFIADFLLQGEYMLGKFSKDCRVWVPALTVHCLVHAVLTFGISFHFTKNLTLSLACSGFDFSMHFAMDRLKASPNLWGRFEITEKYFWWALGYDQTVHHLTHYGIIVTIVYVKLMAVP